MENEKIKHLEFIQSVIKRMASNSFQIKGWSITIVTGLLALSFFKEANLFSLLPLLPIITFWGLDAYFLRQEKLFRELYDDARKAYIFNNPSVELFSMNTKPYKKNVNNVLCVAFSKTLLLFHGTITILVIIKFIYQFFS